MSDHQMGWPMEGKEIKMDFSYTMTDTSKGSAYAKGYAEQKIGVGLSWGGGFKEPDKRRAWTMGWGASYADNGASPYLSGPARFARGGIVEPGNYGIFGERGNGLLGEPAEAIMPLRRLSEDEGQFCAIAPYPGRNWFDSIAGAVKHADKLINTHGGGSKTLIIAKAARVVSREPQPKPPLRVRHPRPHEFA